MPKISELPIATTLTGSEAVPVVQGGVTVQSTTLDVADLVSLSGYVPTSRTVNGHALTADVTLTAPDIGAPSGSGTSTGTNTGDQTTISGNAGTATKLQTARTLWTVSFDGSGNVDGGMTITPVANTSAITVANHTQTTNNPAINIAQTWNNAAVTFTADFLNVTNTASAAGSLIFDRQVGGVSQISVNKSGLVNLGGTAGGININPVIGSGAYSLVPNGITSLRILNGAGTVYLPISASSYLAAAAGIFGWSPTATPDAASDTGLARNAARVMEVNNGTAGTFGDVKLRNLLAGGGNGSYVQTPSMTVANLAAAATAGAGARAFVTDATTTLALGIGVAVTGGGSNKVPVYSDGSSWLVG